MINEDKIRKACSSDRERGFRLLVDSFQEDVYKRQGMASTRMMCPDMTTERNVLGALAQVKGYKKAGKDKMFLCNESNRPVVVLEKKRCV